MSKTLSAMNRKTAYERLEINVGKGTELANRLTGEANIEGLIKELLNQHYGIAATEDYSQEVFKMVPDGQTPAFPLFVPTGPF